MCIIVGVNHLGDFFDRILTKGVNKWIRFDQVYSISVESRARQIPMVLNIVTSFFCCKKKVPA